MSVPINPECGGTRGGAFYRTQNTTDNVKRLVTDQRPKEEVHQSSLMEREWRLGAGEEDKLEWMNFKNKNTLKINKAQISYPNALNYNNSKMFLSFHFVCR